MSLQGPAAVTLIPGCQARACSQVILVADHYWCLIKKSTTVTPLQTRRSAGLFAIQAPICNIAPLAVLVCTSMLEQYRSLNVTCVLGVSYNSSVWWHARLAASSLVLTRPTCIVDSTTNCAYSSVTGLCLRMARWIVDAPRVGVYLRKLTSCNSPFEPQMSGSMWWFVARHGLLREDSNKERYRVSCLIREVGYMEHHGAAQSPNIIFGLIRFREIKVITNCDVVDRVSVCRDRLGRPPLTQDGGWPRELEALIGCKGKFMGGSTSDAANFL